MDGVKVALGSRGMMVEAAQQCTKDRKEWGALVHRRGLSFCLALCELPSQALMDYHL